MTELSDELLVAYVDGQLARAQTKAVEKVLKQDEVIARKVDALKEAHSRFESAFEAILAGELNEITLRADPYVRTTELVAAQAKGRPIASVVLIAILAGLAGYAVPIILPELTPVRYVLPKQTARLPSSWQDDVARMQSLLTRSSLEVGLTSQGNRDLVAFELAQAIGPSLKVPNLDPQGLKWVRGQLLQYRGKPLGQIFILARAARRSRSMRCRATGQPSPNSPWPAMSAWCPGRRAASLICWPLRVMKISWCGPPRKSETSHWTKFRHRHHHHRQMSRSRRHRRQRRTA